MSDYDLFESSIVHSCLVGSHRRVSYKDGAVQTVKLMELSDLAYSLAYEVITSEPPVSVSSALNTIKLNRITHVSNGHSLIPTDFRITLP